MRTAVDAAGAADFQRKAVLKDPTVHNTEQFAAAALHLQPTRAVPALLQRPKLGADTILHPADALGEASIGLGVATVRYTLCRCGCCGAPVVRDEPQHRVGGVETEPGAWHRRSLIREG